VPSFRIVAFHWLKVPYPPPQFVKSLLRPSRKRDCNRKGRQPHHRWAIDEASATAEGI
jgi:hypothetical protein